jgi:hypothetical protein
MRTFGTVDIVVGVLAALGVIVLVIVFVWVFRDRMLKK